MVKKKSRTKIGNEAVDEYIEIRESEGFICASAGRKKRFGSEDFYGIGDVFCLRSDEIRVAQVKANQSRSTYKEMQDWLRNNHANLPSIFVLELAVKKKATKTKPERWSFREVVLPDVEIVTLPIDYVSDDCDHQYKVARDESGKIIPSRWECIQCGNSVCIHDNIYRNILGIELLKCIHCGREKRL